MAQAAPQPDGVDTMLNNLIARSRSNREEAIRAWSHGCNLYARYFSGLGKAHGPEDVLAANADFLLAASEEMSNGFIDRRLKGGVSASAKS
jgi:hypothetical protein